jgi:signal transduction histidine kinase
VGFDPEDIALDQDRSTTIFRILQEALTNVARHSKATRVKVSLKQKDTDLVLRVRDNGKGIAPDKISAAKSFGLMGIRERADLWGGEVKIRGAPDKGTTVTVSIPLEERKADDKDTRR